MRKDLTYWICNKGDNRINDNNKFEDGEVFEIIRNVNLIRLKDGRYQVAEFGSFKKILDGDGFPLIDNEIAKVLKENAPDQIELRPVEIFRRANNQKWTNYSELITKRTIDVQSYDKTESSGINIFTLLNTFIYVSHYLKKIIERELDHLTDIRFKQGLPIMIG